MQGYSSSDDHQPLFTVQGHPVYATTFLIGLFTASMIVVTLLEAGGMDGPLSLLIFSSEAVKHGAIWQLLTYSLVNAPSLGFALDMLMLWWFGREVERFFGRRLFLKFYGITLLIPPLVMMIFGWRSGGVFAGEPGSMGVFLAFATLYPNALLFFNLVAKWVAIILVGIFSMMHLAGHAWQPFLVLWANVGWGYFFVRYEQGRITLPTISFAALFGSRRRPRFRVLPKPESAGKPVSARSEPDAEVDSLLDKIARSGMSSLTAAEREKLERARQNLLKKNL